MTLPVDELQRARALLALQEELGEARCDVNKVLHLAAQRTAVLLGDVAAIWTLESDQVELRAYAHCDPESEPFLERVAARTCNGRHGLVLRVLDQGSTLVVGDELAEGLVPALDPPYQEYFREFGVSGLAVTPLVADGTRFGALGVSRGAGRGPFGPVDQRFLEEIAGVVSFAVTSAQLFEDVESLRVRATLRAREDELTGLLNRRGFLEVLRERSSAPSHPSSLVAVLDMDGFGLVNDGFGHAAGDLVITGMAARLCSALPEAAVVARIGADEFAVLVEGDTDEDLADMIEEAVHGCTGTTTLVGLSVPISVSAGTAVPEAVGVEAVLLQAGLALGRAKREGTTVVAYDAVLDDPATRKLKDVLDLRRAISGGDLVVHYQSVVPVDVGPLRVEALVRRRVDGELLAPGEWLHMADQAGLMPEVTEAVVSQVVEQLALWWGQGLEVECAVNVPAPVLTPDVVAALLARLDAAGLPRRALSVEITEGDLVGPQTSAALARCREAQIDVAVDDFGTGFSALSYLVDLPLRTLKIDRTFVEGIDVDRRRAAVVRAVVDIAHELGLFVVAEGVETVAEADTVIDLGADALQGYLYGYPAGPEAVESALRSGLVAARS